MNNNARWTRVGRLLAAGWMNAGLLGALLLGGGCVTPSNQTGVAGQAQMTVAEAEKAILETLRAGNGFPRNDKFFQGIHVTREGFTATYMSGFGETDVRSCSIEFKELGDVCWREAAYNWGSADLRNKNGASLLIAYWQGPGSVRRFVDAIQTMKYYNSSQPLSDDAAGLADFEASAKAWRALVDKPAIPEAARRFEVLAQDAIQDKDFGKAVDYFERGLDVCPLWPEAQFNAALICGEMGTYAKAVSHMKRYLALCPDAPDAPAARDKMYVWEEKLK